MSFLETSFVHNRGCTNTSIPQAYVLTFPLESFPARPARQVMGKRKQSAPGAGAVAAAKQKVSKKGGAGSHGQISADAMQLPHIKLYDKWAQLISKKESLYI